MYYFICNYCHIPISNIVDPSYIGNTDASNFNVQCTFSTSAGYPIVNSIKVGDATQTTQQLKGPTKKSPTTIGLYFPDTIQFQYNAAYNNLTLMSVADSLIESIPGSNKRGGLTALSMIGGAAKLASQVVQSGASKLIG